MKTYKKGISLIVLVITIIVLSILAATVVISISNANIMSNAQKATFRSDMANFKDIYELYVIDKKIEDFKFKEESLNLTYASNPDEFINIFGNNVPDKYINGLEIKKGKLVYNTENEQELEILGELGMVNLPDPTLTLNLSEVSMSIEDGSTSTYQLNATLANATGTVSWTSSNEDIAEVSSSGLITAKAVGTAIITASYKDIKATCIVNVTLKPILTISEETVSLTIDSGTTATYQLTATLKNATGTLEWSSSNTNIATVTQSGLVTVKAGGEAIITVEYSDDCKATCKVTVKENIKAVIPSDLQIGDTIVYTPIASPTGQYTGATYVKDTNTESETYDKYIESTTQYTPGTMTWVYLGQDENGNAMLTTQNKTAFEMTLAGGIGFSTGPDNMDLLCDKLYGNNTYAKETRNMKIEDIERLVGYTGNKGTYTGSDGVVVSLTTPKTIGEIETELGKTLKRRTLPQGAKTAFEDYLLNSYSDTLEGHIDSGTTLYNLLFGVGSYHLSSVQVSASFTNNSEATFSRVFVWGTIGVNSRTLYVSDGTYESEGSYALRPVVVLNENIQITKSGTSWILEEL